MEWNEQSGVRWLQAELPGATAAFSTRLGGVSEGDFESLNVGIKTEDEPQSVIVNRGRLAEALAIDASKVLMGHQVHGDDLAWHSRDQSPSPFADGLAAQDQVDAQATAERGLVPLVQVADCLPIALAGERGVAMVHGGWRGLAAGIAEKAAREVGATAAAIGPGIGPCCYEVGPEVAAAFEELGEGEGKQMLDLPAIARGRLQSAGVKSIEDAGLCTSCNPDLFFSHRRDHGRTGRQAGLVWIS